ncbi:MAG: YwaF family protein [Lachnospiraceae bacterium]|nr:YwaF family protein [Lachnospiraceae bacterium]
MLQSMMVLLGIAFCVAAAWRLSGMEERCYRRFLCFLGVALLVSEIWKQWVLTYRVYDGHYNVWYFPFQLCSLPLYLCPVYGIVPERWRERIDIFLMDFTLMGGIAVFIDQSGMQYSLPALTAHSYLWHFILIFLGCLSGFRFVVGEGGTLFRDNQCTFTRSLPIWAAGVVIATVLNVALWPLGEISMFYISPFEASTQIVFRDIAARFGITAGNLAYLAVMVIAAALFHLGWCLVRACFRKRLPLVG